MLALDAATVDSLRRLVNRITTDPFVREDLLQEAVVHFWKMEKDRPEQTLSWYLQSCAYHLRHLLAGGRSLDSPKRRSMRVELPQEEDLPTETGLDTPEANVVSQVQVHEIMQQLSCRLSSREQVILNYLADGLGAREIAGRMQVSHPVTIRGRRKIADLAVRLGIRSHRSGSRPARPSTQSESEGDSPTVEG